MRDLTSIISFFSISCGMSVLIIAAILPPARPTVDLQRYQECKQLHPQKYCKITHLGDS
jgi:hypothetical protein